MSLREKPIHIFAENPDPAAMSQFYEAMKQPFTLAGAVMPDIHKGYALPIGSVVVTDIVLVPAWVGYDIGCGVLAAPLNLTLEDLAGCVEDIHRGIHARVPTGFAWQEKDQPAGRVDKVLGSASIYLRNVLTNGGWRQLGTLGGGNHFIELAIDSIGRAWVVVHSGSRNVGHKVASHYMALAAGTQKAREGHYGLTMRDPAGGMYLNDATVCQEFALENRWQILRSVLQAIETVLGRTVCVDGDVINRNHNCVEFLSTPVLTGWVHRKGATSAYHGELGVVPGNMRDGTFIVRGKGNQDSLWSCSHGAGRVASRAHAKANFSLEEFQETMQGIVADVKASTLDEAPMAYKDIFSVMRQQEDLVEVVNHLTPILNVKG